MSSGDVGGGAFACDVSAVFISGTVDILSQCGHKAWRPAASSGHRIFELHCVQRKSIDMFFRFLLEMLTHINVSEDDQSPDGKGNL